MERTILPGSVQPEYLGPPMEVVHSDRPDWSEWNLPFHFDKLVSCLKYFSLVASHRCGALEKGVQNGKVPSSQLARFNRKIVFHFTTVGTCWSNRSDCKNGKHQPTNTGQSRYVVLLDKPLFSQCLSSQIGAGNPATSVSSSHPRNFQWHRNR